MEVYNTYRPVIPIWETLDEHFPGEFEFIQLEKKYRENLELKELQGKKFSAPFNNEKLNSIYYYFRAAIHIITGGEKRRLFFTQPPIFFVFAYFLKKIRGDRYVIHIMDVYPEILYKVFPFIRLFRPFLDPIVTKSLVNADQIIVIGRCTRNLLLEKGVEKKNISYFPNFSGVEVPDTKTNNNQDSLEIVYAGNIGFAHDLSSLLKVAKELEQKNLRITIIAKGVNFEKTKKLAATIGTENVRFLSNLDEETFSTITSNADIHYINLKKGFSGLMVPSKYYTALKLGVPVLYEGPQDSEIYRDVRQFNTGFSFQNNDISSIKKAVLQMLNEEKSFNKDDIQHHYQTHYKLDTRIKEYHSILKS